MKLPLMHTLCMIEVDIFLDVFVNKPLYIGNEQHPIYKIFNAKTNPVSGNREPKTSPKIY